MITMQSSTGITESEQSRAAAYATCTMLPVTDATAMGDCFATSPMFAMQPISQVANEEELHTSFEHAISERIQTMRRVSRKTPSSRKLLVHYTQKYQSFLASASKAWQHLRRGITLTCLALSLMMAGFDLMALLVLYTR
jgi:hypothetical protein